MQWTQQRLGRTHSTPTLCHLAPVAQESIELLKDSIKFKSIDCQNNIDPVLTVLADVAIAKTILRNILANAIKYSPQNGVIKINAAKDDQNVVISVEDQGDGISPTVLEKLFKSSVDSQADSGGIKGTGIGLSLCAELIATQSGRIWVDKNHTKGARIEFSLPMTP